MDLILWRHAEAEEGGPDLERRLTSRGRKQAARMADWLQHRLPSKFSVVASPARRTLETAGALNASVRTVGRLAPGATLEEVLDAAGWPGSRRPVIVVGHQPDLGRVAAHLVSGERADWSVKKGGLWWLTNRVRHDEVQVVVRAVMAPDLL